MADASARTLTVQGMSNTPSEIPEDPAVEGSVEDVPTKKPRRRIRARAIVTPVVLFAVLAGVNLSFRESSFMLMTPGPAPDVTASVSGPIANPDFGKSGRFVYTTVQIDRLTWYGWAKEKVSPTPDSVVVPGAAVQSGPADQEAQASYAQMKQSKAIAYAVASARTLGTPVQGGGAQVASVAPGSVAEKAGLKVGDVVVKVGGMDVHTAEEIQAAVKASTGVVDVDVERSDAPLSVRADLAGGAPLGVEVVTSVPGTPALSVDTSGVGGPSGGLLFTLAFTDALGTGDLTAGRTISGTGTISLDGDVGPINGVADKVLGAKRAGASVFFAPAQNYAKAVAADVDGIEVVKVDTYSDAVDWLCTHGATSSACAKTS